MLEAVGFPVAVNPETRLAALARKRGWLVEHWSKAAGGPRPLLPLGPAGARAKAPRRGGGRSMKALLFERNARPLRRGHGGRPRPARARAPGSGRCGCADVDPPELPGPRLGAHPAPPGRHLRLATWPPSTARRRATSSRSCRFPFVPGHEVVADATAPTAPTGSCSSRCSAASPAASTPPCAACARGDLGNCERIAFGHLEPGLQTGFCCDTGGGWSHR